MNYSQIKYNSLETVQQNQRSHPELECTHSRVILTLHPHQIHLCEPGALYSPELDSKHVSVPWVRAWPPVRWHEDTPTHPEYIINS